MECRSLAWFVFWHWFIGCGVLCIINPRLLAISFTVPNTSGKLAITQQIGNKPMSVLANWKEVIDTANLSPDKEMDVISKWLIITRASGINC
jgi:hypothetical protein